MQQENKEGNVQINIKKLCKLRLRIREKDLKIYRYMIPFAELMAIWEIALIYQTIPPNIRKNISQIEFLERPLRISIISLF